MATDKAFVSVLQPERALLRVWCGRTSQRTQRIEMISWGRMVGERGFENLVPNRQQDKI
jgi:hypothetical protein